ncbi:MAG: hypothetical protein ACO1QB_14740 [Verrucomicrobiales bacterium]
MSGKSKDQNHGIRKVNVFAMDGFVQAGDCKVDRSDAILPIVKGDVLVIKKDGINLELAVPSWVNGTFHPEFTILLGAFCHTALNNYINLALRISLLLRLFILMDVFLAALGLIGVFFFVDYLTSHGQPEMLLAIIAGVYLSVWIAARYYFINRIMLFAKKCLNKYYAEMPHSKKWWK